jgi:hypothetical protein
MITHWLSCLHPSIVLHWWMTIHWVSYFHPFIVLHWCSLMYSGHQQNQRAILHTKSFANECGSLWIAALPPSGKFKLVLTGSSSFHSWRSMIFVEFWPFCLTHYYIK